MRRWSTAWGLAAIAAFALALRTLFSFRHVFRADGVRLTDIDAWYHLRLTENLATNFPERLRLDPFALHPGGQWIPVAPLLDYLAAGIAVVLGGGEPSAERVAGVAAWLPALLGAVTPIALFLVGRRAFGERVGWLAAFFLAFQPGHFLSRSMLGVFDHHVLESLTSCLCLWLISASLQAEPRRARSWLFAAAAGLALAAYQLTWSGGVLLPALLAGWVGLVLLHSAWTGGRGEPGAAIGGTPAASALVAAVVALVSLAPFAELLPRAGTLRLSLFGLGAFALIAALIDGVLRRAGWTRWKGLLTAITSVAVLAVLASLLVGGRLESIGGLVRQLRGTEASRTVSEAKPLLTLLGDGPWWRPLWIYYGTTAFIALPGLVALLAGRVRMTPERLLIVAWTLVSTAVTLAQNRFGYYLSLPLALLAAFVCDAVLGLADARPRPASAGEAIARGATRRRERVLAWAIVLLLVVYPNLGPALAMARTDASIPDAWRDALLWLRDSTPEPFRPGAYWAPASQSRGLVDGGGYGVLAWWDYGYWIAQVGRRPPIANPTQAGSGDAAAVLLETDVERAAARLRSMGAPYVVVDGDLVFLPLPEGLFAGKLDALALFGATSPSRYREVLALRQPDGSTRQILVLYPEYYRTLLARLYLFAGQAVEPRGSTFVIEVEGGRLITSVERFAGEDEAQAFVREAPGADRRLVGLELDRSPIRLDAATGFEQVYVSPYRVGRLAPLPALRIFAAPKGPAPAGSAMSGGQSSSGGAP